MVNCASLSCARLPAWAYTGRDLEEQLETRSRAFLQAEDNVRIENGKLLLSRYFDWYGADFTDPDWRPTASSIPSFVALYATPSVAERIAAESPAYGFLDYDWTLNQAH